MAVFEYRGLLAATGKTVHDVRDADNPKALRAQLKREGILLTEATEVNRAKSASSGGGGLFAFFRRVTVTDVAMMTRQLATLVGAGIPLVEAVSALTEQVEKDEMKRVLALVRDRLNEGSSLAKALEAHPKVFPPLYVNMVAAGEASGTLEVVLDRLSDFMENQARLKGKVSAALAYPILMLIIGTSLITIMMVVVVPKVTSIFASLDRALPWYTSVLIFISAAVSSNVTLGGVFSLLLTTFVRRALAPGPSRNGFVVAASFSGFVLVLACFFVESLSLLGLGVFLGLLAGIGLGQFLSFVATPQGQLWKDGVALRAPIFGVVVRMLAVSRFSKTLATLLKSGVPLLKAMDIVKNVLDNAKLSKVVEEAIGSIREGESIAGPLRKSGQFPPIVTHMIAVGEKSGQLEQMLENVAKAYDSQVETRIQAMTALLEPIIIVFMGGGVGFIAFSILMPLIQMNDFVQ
jgi:general secretion pathway protein F